MSVEDDRIVGSPVLKEAEARVEADPSSEASGTAETVEGEQIVETSEPLSPVVNASLPESFPYRADLAAGGFDTVEKLNATIG